ncbi:MAG TPA: HAD-IA family hydrolase [Planctomycetota bacterium]|nr:HAD-IA family hydrolase [Planctomycetota bacterium]
MATSRSSPRTETAPQTERDFEAFLEPARQLAVRPEACLLIDDSPENVVAAQALGMDAISFKHAGTLTRDLAARGLLGE